MGPLPVPCDPSLNPTAAPPQKPVPFAQTARPLCVFFTRPCMRALCAVSLLSPPLSSLPPPSTASNLFVRQQIARRVAPARAAPCPARTRRRFDTLAVVCCSAAPQRPPHTHTHTHTDATTRERRDLASRRAGAPLRTAPEPFASLPLCLLLPLSPLDDSSVSPPTQFRVPIPSLFLPLQLQTSPHHADTIHPHPDTTPPPTTTTTRPPLFFALLPFACSSSFSLFADDLFPIHHSRVVCSTTLLRLTTTTSGAGSPFAVSQQKVGKGPLVLHSPQHTSQTKTAI